jgi:hypothetical protein
LSFALPLFCIFFVAYSRSRLCLYCPRHINRMQRPKTDLAHKGIVFSYSVSSLPLSCECCCTELLLWVWGKLRVPERCEADPFQCDKGIIFSCSAPLYPCLVILSLSLSWLVYVSCLFFLFFLCLVVTLICFNNVTIFVLIGGFVLSVLLAPCRNTHPFLQ